MRVFALALVLVATTPVFAQHRAAQPAAPHLLPCDPLNLIPGCKQDNGSIFQPGALTPQAVWANIKKAGRDDLTYAVAVAAQAGTDTAVARSKCYQSILDTAASIETATAAPSTTIKDAKGTELAKPTPSAVSDFEVGLETLERGEQEVTLALQALQPNSPMMVKCAEGAAATGQNALSFINNLALGAAGLAAIAARLGIPLPVVP